MFHRLFSDWGNEYNHAPGFVQHGPWRGHHEDNTLVESSFSATINAPIEHVDISSGCFSLPESEYQSCSPAHCSAGATTTDDGRRMSINVEILGGSLMVQHYVEEIGQPDHLRLVSTSDRGATVDHASRLAFEKV